MVKLICKSASIIMSAVMVLSLLAGCAGKAKTDSSETTIASSAAAETTEAPKPPVSLLYVDEQTLGRGTVGEMTDSLAIAVKEATGVQLMNDPTINAEKLPVLLAAGDVPDIIAYGTGLKQTVKNLIDAGELMELTALVDSNGPNIKALAGKALQFSRDDMGAGNGGLYAIPTRLVYGSPDQLYYQPYVNIHIRWDYFKEIGKPAFNTLDDAANAIIDIQKKHPTTSEGKKTYGMSMWSDWGMWHYTVLSEVVYGIIGKGGANFIDTKNYEYIDGLNSDRSPLWVDAAFYNKLYRAGVLDPDSFTQTYDQANAKFNAGQVIAQAAYWLTSTPNAELSKAGSDYLAIPINNASINCAQYNPVGSKYYSISAKAKYPDRAIDVLNWMYSTEGSRTLLNGVKGDTWTEDAGKATLTDKGLTRKSDPNFMKDTGLDAWLNSTPIDPMAKDISGNQFVDLFNEPEVANKTLTQAQKEWLETFGFSSSNDLWHEKGGYAVNSLYDQLLPVLSDDYKRTSAKIDGIIAPALAALVMSKDDETFTARKDKLIKEVTAIKGYEEMVAEIKAAIEKAKTDASKY